MSNHGIMCGGLSAGWLVDGAAYSSSSYPFILSKCRHSCRHVPMYVLRTSAHSDYYMAMRWLLLLYVEEPHWISIEPEGIRSFCLVKHRQCRWLQRNPSPESLHLVLCIHIVCLIKPSKTLSELTVPLVERRKTGDR